MESVKGKFKQIIEVGIIRPSFATHDGQWLWQLTATPSYLAQNLAEKKMVRAPFGLFQFGRMPFRLHNAAETLKRFLDPILRDMNFVYVCIDDIFIASTTKRLQMFLGMINYYHR